MATATLVATLERSAAAAAARQPGPRPQGLGEVQSQLGQITWSSFLDLDFPQCMRQRAPSEGGSSCSSDGWHIRWQGLTNDEPEESEGSRSAVSLTGQWWRDGDQDDCARGPWQLALLGMQGAVAAVGSAGCSGQESPP